MGVGGLLSMALRSVADLDTLNCLAWLEVREESSGCAGDLCISTACGQKKMYSLFLHHFPPYPSSAEKIHFLFVNINLSELGNLLPALMLEALCPFVLPERRAPHACYLLSDQL